MITAVACPRCDAAYSTVGMLAAHLAFTHTMPDDRAMAEAQRAAGACPVCNRTTGAHNKSCPYRETPAVTVRAEAKDAAGVEPAVGEWGHGPRKENLPARKENASQEENETFPASIWGPLTCPRCPNGYPRRVQLAQHLMNTHGLTSTAALRAAQDVDKTHQRDAEREERASAVTSPVTPLPESPAPKETTMPTTVCSYCKKSDGEHTEGCKRKEGCKLCRRFAPAKCQRHGGPRRKPATGGGKHRAKPKRVLKTRGRVLNRPEPAVSVNGHAPDRATVTGARDLLKNKLEEQLVDARAEVRALERMLGTLA